MTLQYSVYTFCLHHSELTELNTRLQSAAERSRTENEGLVDQIRRLSAEKVSTDVENKRLKVRAGKSFEISHISNGFLKCVF